MTKTKEEFCQRANEIFEECCIGKHDNGTMWFEYSVDMDGDVMVSDYSTNTYVPDWASLSDEDITIEARQYLAQHGL